MERNILLCYCGYVMMNKKVITFLTVVVFLVGFSAWKILPKNQLSKPLSDKMPVTASFYPLAFLAEEIGGDKVQVLNLTPAGAEPHEYEPTSRDIAEMENSSVLIMNGLGLEPWYENIKSNINPQKTFLLVAGEGLGDVKTKDPHIWLSPALMNTMAKKIEKTFEKADPENEVYYRTNLQTLSEKLLILDGEYRQGLVNCAQKNIITSHTAFGYMTKSYGLVQVSIAGLSPDAEPSPKTMGDIVVFAKTNNVKYIFFESLASPKLSQTIANETGAKTLVLNPLEGLTKQQLSQGKNYLSVMRENLVNLQIALSCPK
ncbi:MAG: zinc ABC transporter substrate-binding protein [Candidatus Parcubacteria bacterium]|nr:zinc ABC transporter substrate-binding protein [Candidatus Parcubacteria bacterium]